MTMKPHTKGFNPLTGPFKLTMVSPNSTKKDPNIIFVLVNSDKPSRTALSACREVMMRKLNFYACFITTQRTTTIKAKSYLKNW